jgi:hypothetical protein
MAKIKAEWLESLKRQDKLMTMVEVPFRRAVLKEKNRFIRAVAVYAAGARSISDDLYAEHKSNMRAVFDKYYSVAIRVFSREVENTVLKNHTLALEKKQEFWDFLFVQYVNEQGAEKAQVTASTTRSDIQSAIDATLAAPDGVSETRLIKNILSVRGISAFRANTIARTETHAAAMFASINTSKKIQTDTGIVRKKKWIPALDDRTRDAHAAMATQPAIGMESAFNVNGEKMDRPGDPKASAGNVINCRCVLVYPEE